MGQLQHVDVADGDRLVELVAAHTVEEVDLAGVRQTRDFQQVADFRFARAVENRRGEGNAFAEAFSILEQLFVTELRQSLPDRGVREYFTEPAAHGFGADFFAEQALEAVPEFLGGPAEVCLENLSDVHARRNAERIQNDLDRSAVRHVGHVFLRHDAGDDALVAVASGHLVADGELALHGDVDLDQLDDARGKLVALLELVLALLGDLAKHVDLTRGHLLDFFDLLDEQRILFVELQALEVARGDLFDDFARQLDALGQQALVGLLVVEVGLEHLAAKKIREALEALIREDANFVGQILLQLEDLRGFDGLVALVLFSALAGEDLNVHDGALDARRAVERSVANIAGLFAEDSAEQLFFRGERGLALGRNLADKDVARLHDRADADDSAFVKVAKEGLADVGDIASNFLGAKLGVARFDFVLLDVDRGVVVVLDQLFADKDGVFEVVAAPRHESHEDVAAESKFAALCARAIGKNLALLHAVADANQRLLADASVLVRTLELDELIDVRADFPAEHAGVIGFHAHDDAFGVNLIDDAFALAEHHGAGIARCDALHASADQRRFALDERNRLALHVGAHQRAVGVVVFEERNQAGCDRDELFGRNVDIVDFIAALQDEVPCLPAVDPFGGDLQTVVERNVGLRDDVLVLLPSGEVEAVRLVNDLAPLEFFIEILDLVLLDDFTGLEFAVTGIDDLNVVDDAPALDLAVGRLDEAVVIDPREAAQRADQADVRAFRRFNRADAAVMGRVHVADLESRALARETARPKGRETPLVRNFAERVGLVHELAELRRTEELSNRGHHGLGVHQVVRHRRGHFLIHAHLFLDGALHADEADAELVLKEFAHRANAAVAEMVDVVDDADVLAQLEQILDRRNEVRRIQRAVVQGRVQTHLDVELQAANAAEIVLARIEEHAAEKVRRRFQCRWIAGAQLTVDFDQRFLRRANRVLVQRAREHHADVVALREEHVHFCNAAFGECLPELRGQWLIGFEQNFSRLAVDDVGDAVSAFEVGQGGANLGNFRLDQFLEEILGDALVRTDNHFIRFRIADFVGQLALHDSRRNVPEEVLVPKRDTLHLIEGTQNILVGLHAQRAQEDGAQELALAVDSNVQNVLGVVFEFNPGSAVRNDFSEEVASVIGALEENARRAVQLRNDDALRAVDDKRAVLRHQWNIAVENFLFLDVADGLRATIGILVINGQPDGDLERRGVRHAALLALVHVILQLHGHRIAALVAEGWRVLVERAALVADDVAGLIRIGDHGRAAIAARRAEVVQALQVAALALPVADRVVHEFQLRHLAEVPDRKHGSKHRLKPAVIALARQKVHLQETLIRLHLDFNQVGNLDRALDFREIQALAFPDVVIAIRHA